MYKFNNLNLSYEIDKEISQLVNNINCLPGIQTCESCFGHGKSSCSIYFKVFPSDIHQEGLFFLTRCVDRRYWKYGHTWNITLSVSDAYKSHLPVIYELSSTNIGNTLVNEINDLNENMIYHLNHEGFIKLYNIDLCNFNVIKFQYIR